MARRALSSPNTALSNENGHNGQETRGACPEEEEEDEEEEKRSSLIITRTT